MAATVLYATAIPTFVQQLRALSAQLDKGEAFARAAGRDPADLVEARLAPDMFPLSAQVRFACIQAREAVERLAGRTPSAPPEAETTMAGLKARIAATIEALNGAAPSDFEGAEDRPVALAMPNGMTFDMSGSQFVRDWALPQFYFHVVTAYAILRREGVDLGKADYVSHMAAYLRGEARPG